MTLQDNDLTAYYYPATKKIPANVTIYRFDADAGRQVLVTPIRVEGMKEAREVAARMNATPWNF